MPKKVALYVCAVEVPVLGKRCKLQLLDNTVANTSKIQSINGTTIETLHTIYKLYNEEQNTGGGNVQANVQSNYVENSNIEYNQQPFEQVTQPQQQQIPQPQYQPQPQQSQQQVVKPKNNKDSTYEERVQQAQQLKIIKPKI
ncbi:MAG: hypothetical protein II625_01300 [Bacilli bacterium]|nr:hypothetical protein [Bacilli bacterium]